MDWEASGTLCNFVREERGISGMGPNKLGKGHDMRGALYSLAKYHTLRYVNTLSKNM